MKIAIQVSETSSKAWDDILPVLHEVENHKEAELIAYAISKQFGRVTVRLTVLSDNYQHGKLRDYIGRLSGAYLQAR